MSMLQESEIPHRKEFIQLLEAKWTGYEMDDLKKVMDKLSDGELETIIIAVQEAFD